MVQPHPLLSRIAAGRLGRFWRQSTASPKQLVVLVVVSGVGLILLLYLFPLTRYAFLSHFISKTVSFVVVDQTTTQPITGATVQFNHHSLATNSQGEVRFTNVPVGMYTVSASQVGYLSLTQALKVPIWTTLPPVILQLTAAGTHRTSDQNNGGSNSGSHSQSSSNAGQNHNSSGVTNNGNGSNGGSDNGGNNGNGGGNGGGGQAPPCNPSGVTPNPDGSYTFAQLHVDGVGNIVDASSCQVILTGFNDGGGDADSGGGAFDPEAVKYYQANIGSNFARMSINNNWYVNNIIVPEGGPNHEPIHYQDMIDSHIKFFKSLGIYAEIDPNTNFSHLPCSKNGDPDCPPQGLCATISQFNDINNKECYHNDAETMEYEPYAESVLQILAAKYSGDPQVLFNAWNEPISDIFVTHQNDFQNYRSTNTQRRINIIRGADPNALVFVFSTYQQEDYKYQQPNLVFDFHVYDSFGKGGLDHGWLFNASSQAQFVDPLKNATKNGQPYNRGVCICEWGGGESEDPLYDAGLVATAVKYHMAVDYFQPGDVLHYYKGNTFSLTLAGENTSKDYQAIWGSLGGNTSPGLLPSESTTNGTVITKSKTNFFNSLIMWLN